MAQPFMSGGGDLLKPWEGLTAACMADHIAICSAIPLYTLSSAIFGGGLAERSIFTNWQVPLDFDCDRPVAAVRSCLQRDGYDPGVTVAMLTAADIRKASVQTVAAEQFRLFCCVTAGTSNAIRMDNRLSPFVDNRPGTINCVLVIDAMVAPAALVNMVITATEAKSAALQDLLVSDEHGKAATGTSTDAIAVACSRRAAYTETHQYAGPASTLGNAVGKVVYEAVCEAVSGDTGRLR